METLIKENEERQVGKGPSGWFRNYYFPHDVHEHLRVKISVGRLFLTAVFLAGIFPVWLLAPLPKVENWPQGTKRFRLDESFSVSFSRPVKRNELSFGVTPQIEGEWRWEEPMAGKHLFSKVSFVPKNLYQPDKAYEVSLKGISRITGGKSYDFSFKVLTQKMPEVLAVEVKGGNEAVQPSGEMFVALDEANPNLAEFTFEFDPPAEFESRYDIERKGYRLELLKPLSQGQSYKIKVSRSVLVLDAKNGEVLRKDTPVVMKESTFKVATPPGLESFEPSGGQVFVSTSKARFVFSQPMDRQSAEESLEISPAVNGSFVWISDAVLEYRFAKNLEYGRNYRFVVKKGAKNKAGGFLTADSVSSFTTIGNAYVYQTSPAAGARGVGTAAKLSFSFDQAVDHASAERLFWISGDVKGRFGWQGNSMYFYPDSALSRDTRYTAKVRAGVKSLAGLSSTQEFSTSFTTETTVVKLNIPLDYQDFPLSCEVASLKMALGYKGIKVSETTLMGLVGYDPTPHVGNVWGDPDVAFVGNLSGRQNTTGYGVHWDPIAKAANNYRQAKAFRGWSASQLAQELANGNPVVMWGIYPGGYYNPWHTPSGKMVPAWKGEHVRTVIGFTGPIAAPTQFIVNDPITGQSYWPASFFVANWKTYGNSGVVVY